MPPMIEGSFVRKLHTPQVYKIAILKGYDKPYSDNVEGKMVIVASRYVKRKVILSLLFILS